MQQRTASQDAIKAALSHGGLVDITTTGRTSGEPRRIEIAYHVFDGRIYISGRPNPARKRAWLANLEADPNFTFHLKQGVSADLPAVARVIAEPDERRAILAQVARAWGMTAIESMMAYSPLIEVTISGPAPATA